MNEIQIKNNIILAKLNGACLANFPNKTRKLKFGLAKYNLLSDFKSVANGLKL